MKQHEVNWKRYLCFLVAFCMITAYLMPSGLVNAQDNASVLWVDPANGSDTNVGTSESAALKTIQAATSLASQMSESSDVIVYLKGGTYAYGETIVFGEAESGKNGHTITYKSASGETAIISGGTTLNGWTLHDAENNIYVTDIPEGSELVRQFYVDGQPQSNAYTETSPVDWQLLSTGGYVSPYVTTADSNEYLILDLGEVKQVSCVTLYAGNEPDANVKAAGFPKDFTISTSVDGENWEVKVSETDYETPSMGACVEFVFDTVSARYAKLDVTELGTPERLNPKKYNLALSEVRVGLAPVQNTTVIDLNIVQHLDYSNNLLTADKVRVGYYDGTDISSFVDDAHSAVPISNLVDGDTSTFASTAAQLDEWLLVNGGYHTQAFLFEFGETVSVSALELTVRSATLCCPNDFDIQTSTDGVNWMTVISEEDFDWSACQDLTEVFVFNPVPAAYIRVLGHDTVPEYNASADVNYYYLQFTEAAVYKPADVALGATVDAPNNDQPDSTWDKDYLANGVFDGMYTSCSTSSASSIEAPVTLDMHEVKTISAVRLYPRYNSDGPLQYVTSVRISVSGDGLEYQPVLELSDVAQPSWGAQLFVFPEVVEARYVRIEPLEVVAGTGETTVRFQLAEIEVVPASNSYVTPSYDESDFAELTLTSADLITFGFLCPDSGYLNNAELDGYPHSYVLDGNENTVGSTPAGMDAYWFNGHANGSTYVFIADVDVTQNENNVAIGSIALTCTSDTSFAPYSFEIQVTTDGSNWTTVETVEAYEWTAGETATFSFSAAEASRVRLYVTEVIPAANGVIYEPDDIDGVNQNVALYLRLAEFSAYGVEIISEEPTINSVEAELNADDILGFGHFFTGDSTFVPYSIEGWDPSNIIDGDTSTVCVTAGYQYGWLVDFGGGCIPCVMLDVSQDDGPTTINTIELTVRYLASCAPYHFLVQVTTAADTDNWTTVLEVNDETWSDTLTKQFAFDAVDAYKLRLVAYNLCPEDKTDWSMDNLFADSTCYGDTRFGLSELNLYYVYDTTNQIPSNIITQGITSGLGEDYEVKTVTAKNDNSDTEYNANKAIDGYITPTENLGWSVPEYYNFEEISNVTDVEIHFLNLWYHSFTYVSDVSGDGTEVYASTGGRRPTWLANAYEFIDTVGEWYIDRTEGKIYYKANGTMENKEAVLPVVEQIVSLEGASNITFDGIVFEHSSYTLPSTGGYEDAQANTWVSNNEWIQVDGGIMIDSCTNITITNCEVRNMGTIGIKARSMDSRTDGVVITNNLIHDISYSGIVIGEVYTHSDYESYQLVTDTTIRNNYVTRVGLDMYDSPAIVATYTNGTIIDHNEIAYCPYTGISTGWGWDEDNELAAEEVGNNQVTNNLVHDPGKVNRDGGSIYNLGSSVGSVISGNYVYNSWDGEDTYENGIYLDQGSAYIEVRDNVVGANVGYWMHMWRYTIHDNYWHDNFYAEGSLAWNDSTNSTVVNNTEVAAGEWEDYAAAVSIMNNAGLTDESVKGNVTIGFASEHNVVQEIYPNCNSRYFKEAWGWSDVLITGQISTTIYDGISHKVTMVMPAGTDLSSLALTYSLDDGWTCDKASGSVQDFTNPVTYTLTNGEKTVVWTVTARLEVLAGGEITGTDLYLDDIISDYEAGDWTVAPTEITDDSLVFNTYSGYVAERFDTDTILHFDITSNLNSEEKDWLQISLKNQDPYTMCVSGGTEYNIGFNNGDIEVQKFVDGERTVLYGIIDGYTSVYGSIPNNFFTSGVRHSITVGAINVDDGVRLFLFVDGNLIFDIIDNDDPITDDGFFAVYAMTQTITLSEFTNIQNVENTGALETAIAGAKA